ncbi:hypothetical protein DVH24_024313 [Malus domestica]|uniref:Serine-threonine/tyrosine-protein kinase catalytic domain-containing protein n=1 Tax=Malus domestica TaxID=3750 RepID=A0A498JFK8_MALDO|nr:hypothetical protein DVH24_024313 [Malus domestica]
MGVDLGQCCNLCFFADQEKQENLSQLEDLGVSLLKLSYGDLNKTILNQHRKLPTACSSIDFHGNEFKALVNWFKVKGSLEEWLNRSIQRVNMSTNLQKHSDLIQRVNIAIDLGYGILLFEMLTGKWLTDDMFKDGMNLHNFIMMALPKCVEEVCHPLLLQREESNTSTKATYNAGYRAPDDEGQRVEACLICVARIVVACSAVMPRERRRRRREGLRRRVSGESVVYGGAVEDWGIRGGDPERLGVDEGVESLGGGSGVVANRRRRTIELSRWSGPSRLRAEGTRP